MKSILSTLLFSLLTTTTLALPATLPPSSSDLVPRDGGKVSFAGINMSGFDFGCTTDGTCRVGSSYDIANHGNAIAQMNHFVRDDGLNTFRLPVGWQYLVNDQLGGPLDPEKFGNYDRLVRGCLDSGARLCIIDIHNYGRWYGGIIGQGGPGIDQYCNLLWRLAYHYKDEPRIAFDIMNEPHDLDMNMWAVTVQAAVNVIRIAGAQSQIILLPGTNYASAGAFIWNSANWLSGIKNPDGSNHNLIFNVHQYLDYDYTGTHTTCSYNNIENGFKPLANWLRQNGRKAMLTETGAGAYDGGCIKLFCEQIDFINQNSDVFKGVVTWAAGGFDSNYELTETPVQHGDWWEDKPLVSQCIVAKFRGADGVL